MDTTGTYTFTSSAANNMDTHGYFYNDTFYPLNPTVNLIKEDDDSAGNVQFRLTVTLEAGVPYTLVATSHGQSITGSYSVTASGPGNAQMTRIDPIDLTTTSKLNSSSSKLLEIFSSHYYNTTVSSNLELFKCSNSQ